MEGDEPGGNILDISMRKGDLFRDRLDALYSIRAAIVAADPEACPNLRELSEWVESNSERDVAKRFLEVMDAKEKGSQSVGKVTSSRQVGQIYTVLLNLIGVGMNTQDKRPWELLQIILQRDDNFKGRVLQCTFLSNTKSKRTFIKEPRFLTSPATAFELTLFVYYVRLVLNCHVRRPGSPKPKRRKVLEHYKITRETSQRIAFVVQQVIRAWDVQARSLGLRDCEEMILPYIVFQEDQNDLTLQVPEKGFAPKHQKHTITVSTPRLGRDDVCEVAYDRIPAVDHAFRCVATSVLEDIRVLVTDDFLYEMSPDKSWGSLDRFKIAQETFISPMEGLPVEYATLIKNSKPSRDIDVILPERSSEAARQANMRERSRSRTYRKFAQRQVSPSARSSIDEIKQVEENARIGRLGNKEESSTADETLHCSEQSKSFASTAQKKCSGSTCECHAALKELETAMKGYARSYACHFKELMQLDIIDSSDCIGEAVQLVLCDPPYNYRRANNLPNSDHDELSETDMEACVQEVDFLLREGGHAIIFCSPLQFRDWYKAFSSVKVGSSSEDEDEELGVETPLVQGEENKMNLPEERLRKFSVDPSPITMTNSPGHFYTNVVIKTTALRRITEVAVHVTKKGLSKEEAFAMVNYKNFNYVCSRHLAWTNAIDNVPRLSKGERLKHPRALESRFEPLRPEQKPRSLLMELISRFTQPGDFVVDMFAGTFSTGASCLLLEKHRRFIGCDIDEMAWVAGKENLLVSFAQAILDPSSDIKIGHLKPAAKLYLAHSKTNARTIKYREEWSPRTGLASFQEVPEYIVQFLATKWRLPEVLQICGKKPVSKWPKEHLGRLHTVQPEQLLWTELVGLDLIIAPSKKYSDDRMGIFTINGIKQGKVVCPYYGTLVYRDLSKCKEVYKRYGEEGILGCTPEAFRLLAVQVPNPSPGIMQSKVKEVFIVPADFSAGAQMARIAREPLQSKTPPKLRRPAANVMIAMEGKEGLTMKSLCECYCLHVVAIEDLKAGEELFLETDGFYVGNI